MRSTVQSSNAAGAPTAAASAPIRPRPGGLRIRLPAGSETPRVAEAVIVGECERLVEREAVERASGEVRHVGGNRCGARGAAGGNGGALALGSDGSPATSMSATTTPGEVRGSSAAANSRTVSAARSNAASASTPETWSATAALPRVLCFTAGLSRTRSRRRTRPPAASSRSASRAPTYVVHIPRSRESVSSTATMGIRALSRSRTNRFRGGADGVTADQEIYNCIDTPIRKIASGRAFRAHTADTTHIYGEPLISTMSRTALIENITAMLEDADFLVSDRCGPAQELRRGGPARRGPRPLEDPRKRRRARRGDRRGDAPTRRVVYLQATPMVIGIRTRDEEKPGVVYFRHGVPVINPDTGYDLFVEGMPPLIIYAAPAGSTSASTATCWPTSARSAAGRARPSRHRTRRLATHRLEVRRRDERLHRGGDPAGRSVQRAVLQPGRRAGTAPARSATPTPPSAPETDPDDEHVLHVLTNAGFTVHPTARAPFKAVSEDEGSPPRGC